MAARRRRGPLVTLALITAVAAAGTLFVPAGALAATTPTVRLVVASSRILVQRQGRGDFVGVDPGAFVAPAGGSFELHVGRHDYDTPITVDQVDADTGTTLRTIPADMLDGWFGLRRFAEIEILDRDDTSVLRHVVSFCPNAYEPERLSDDSPLTPTYPYLCGGYSPFIMGQVWGVDQGWAASLMGDPWGGGLYWKADRGHYRIEIQIEPAWVDVLGIDPSQAYGQVRVRVVDAATPSSAGARQRPTSPTAIRYAATPIVTDPDPSTLPDIVATPAWGLQAFDRRRHDYLTFNATEWNSGPGMMVIDGFRTDDTTPTMDAYQYFLQDGQPVGRAPIGQLVYDLDHQHWHFDQFAQYSLLDADKNPVMVSDKRSWCLAPTDPMDLLVENADWRTYPQDLYTSCGSRQTGALWLREVLPVGWGDTYTQYLNGGALDISAVPNGWYYVRTQVNPTGAIYEGSSDDNIADRLIRLRGTPGHRRVVVPPWHGIDTEHGCPFCPF
jgi:Lysyl oxidase